MSIANKTKERVLKEIYNFFIKSRDFNGIPLTTLASNLNIEYKSLLPIVKELILEDNVSIQNGENPHIIRFNHHTSNQQLELLKKAEKNKEECLDELNIGGENAIRIMTNTHLLCAYPSMYYLKQYRKVKKYDSIPFSKRLALGEPQVYPAYFELNVLERYLNDPRYNFKYENYRGYIYTSGSDKNTMRLKKKDHTFLQSFGLGYDNRGKRVVVVFLRYLSDLNANHQNYWKSKEITTKCTIVKEYVENSYFGEWSRGISFFSAFIQEQKIINDLCRLINRKIIFKNTFEDGKAPREFSFFLSPTLHNYESFISLLDKMISENINKDFFKGFIDLVSVDKISNNMVERKQKGTLNLLEEWLSKYFRFDNNDGLKMVMEPLKLIRKERQKPAHKISENYYDEKLFQKQKQLMKDVYLSVSNLRYIFSKHPNTIDYKMPDWLSHCEIKDF